jgi:hypothetical protein
MLLHMSCKKMDYACVNVYISCGGCQMEFSEGILRG